ncbi:hypothetical protein Golob_025427 [Gossypium lobatum]|uniref:Zinc knuckle CX2CX4HX4C domain-containing protein n=1 Tax=Gossypium lobatum TaxID=34289 RepID=A0A7J8NG16_9ROSI|nr:hypothetical protein [Gossypium lobatum]
MLIRCVYIGGEELGCQKTGVWIKGVRSKSGSCRREEEAFQEEENELEEDYKFCLVGSCLTNSVMHFPSLRNTMVDLWHPIGGISITYLDPTKGGSEYAATDICGVLGADTRFASGSNVGSNGHPLKRKKKIVLGTSRTIYARFQYEKLSLFCFLCGKLGHGENFCLVRVRVDSTKIIFGWDISLRAPANERVSKWEYESNVKGPNNSELIELGSYGKDSPIQHSKEWLRDNLWDLLHRLGQDQTVLWLIVGDFNKIAYSFEKNDG